MQARALWGSVLLGLSGTVGAHQLPAGVAEHTVRQFVELFDLEVLFESGRLASYHTHAVDSDDAHVALHQLLDGTGLKLSYINARAISVDPNIPPPRQDVFDIPGGPALDTLRTLASQAHSSILYDPTEVRGVTTYPTRGVFSLQQALETILHGTKLTYNVSHGHIISISLASPPIVPPPPARQIPALDNNRIATQHKFHPVLPTLVITAPVGRCECAQTYTEHGWVDSQWCKYEDGRKEYVPDRCPVPAGDPVVD